MVEENYGLVGGYMRDRNLDDEWSGLLSIELCKAVMKHNPKKSKLSTYYYMRCNSMVNKEYQKTQYKKRFNNGIYELNDENVTCDYTENQMDDFLVTDELLNGEHGEIIQLRLEGYTQTEIASKLGTSQANISKIFQKIRDDYRYDE